MDGGRGLIRLPGAPVVRASPAGRGRARAVLSVRPVGVGSAPVGVTTRLGGWPNHFF